MLLRRHVLTVGVAAVALGAVAAHAQSAANPVKALLGQASDHALDQLAKPGAFSADEAIRIALPGAAQLGNLLDLAHKAGLTGDLKAASIAPRNRRRRRPSRSSGRPSTRHRSAMRWRSPAAATQARPTT